VKTYDRVTFCLRRAAVEAFDGMEGIAPRTSTARDPAAFPHLAASGTEDPKAR
jgi:hypothetical protein